MFAPGANIAFAFLESPSLFRLYRCARTKGNEGKIRLSAVTGNRVTTFVLGAQFSRISTIYINCVEIIAAGVNSMNFVGFAGKLATIYRRNNRKNKYYFSYKRGMMEFENRNVRKIYIGLSRHIERSDFLFLLTLSNIWCGQFSDSWPDSELSFLTKQLSKGRYTYTLFAHKWKVSTISKRVLYCSEH